MGCWFIKGWEGGLFDDLVISRRRNSLSLKQWNAAKVSEKLTNGLHPPNNDCFW